jgi:hypothetical protein
MKDHFNNGGSKKIRFFENLVRFIEWCDSHGIFKFLADIVLRLIIWFLTNKQ